MFGVGLLSEAAIENNNQAIWLAGVLIALFEIIPAEAYTIRNLDGHSRAYNVASAASSAIKNGSEKVSGAVNDFVFKNDEKKE